MVVRKGKPNFTEGPIFFRLLLFTLPIIATSLLQVAYNMADNIVVGQFSGDEYALAAVGQTSAYNGLLINLIIGISAGAGVVVAQIYGANRRAELSRSIHTAMTLSLIVGGILCVFGLLASRPILSLIISEQNHEFLLDKSTLYMIIISLGLPALSVYNFAGAIMRSLGDSRTPLIVLGLSGLVNVGLNLVFVIFFHMSILGVALATIVSQYMSAVVLVIMLLRAEDESQRLVVSKLGIDRPILTRSLLCGVPAAIQNSIFSFANMILASAIGTLPVAAISANTIANNVDSITYQCMNGFASSVMTFAGQNFGAMKKKRIWKTFWYTMIQVALIGVIVGQIQLVFWEQIAGLFVAQDMANRAEVMAITREVMGFLLTWYPFCGIMGAIGGFLRGLGMSTSPMLASVISVITVRLTWIYMFFPYNPTSITWLYICYPITWISTILIEAVMLVFAAKKLKGMGDGEVEPEPSGEEKVTA